jgi:hypothetical protein
MAKSRKHSVSYAVRQGKSGTPGVATTLRSYNDAVIFDFDCGGARVLTVEITGGGQIHFHNGKDYKHIRASSLAKQFDKLPKD